MKYSFVTKAAQHYSNRTATFATPMIQTKNMPLVWRTDHVNALVNVSARYIIPVRRTEHGRDYRGLFGSPQFKSAPHCSAREATAKRFPTRCVNISPVCSSTVA
jgi:hypothetical protein